MNTIAEKIAKAAEEIGRLEKDGYNKFHDYEYVTEASVKAAVGPALRRNGLYILDVSHTPVTNVAGVDFTKVLVMTVVTVSDGINHVTSTALGSGTDKGDKAAYKAMAGGLKYALTSLFLIATGDDAEADGGKPEAKPAKAASKTSDEASSKPAKATKAEKKAETKAEDKPAEDAPSATESTNASLKALELIKGIGSAAELTKATGELAKLRAKMLDADFQIVKAEFAAKRAAVEGK